MFIVGVVVHHFSGGLFILINDRKNNWHKLQLSLYLMPVFGTVFALISLVSSPEKDPQTRKVTRLSLQLGLGWLVLYSGLWLSSSFANDLFSLRLLYLNGMITTGYFLACLFFILRLWSSKK